jgi:MFS transporter, FSR family, fosmidomycin resistance protein
VLQIAGIRDNTVRCKAIPHQERPGPAPDKTMLGILVALSASHLINDTLQALLPAIYPMLKASFGLTFTQIGMITFSLPAHGLDPAARRRHLHGPHPKPYSLAFGMALTLAGLVVPVAGATSYGA